MPNLNTNTLAQLSAEAQVFYDKQLIKVAEPLCAYKKHAQKTVVPKNGGSTVNWRDMKKLGLSTNALTDGETPDGKKLSIVPINAQIHSYGDYVTTTDNIDLMAIDNVVMQATKRLGLQAAESLDFLAGSVYCSGKNALFGGGVKGRDSITSDSVISILDVMKAAQFLKSKAAPTIDGSYFAIIHPAVVYDLMKADGLKQNWIDVNVYGNQKQIVDGELGKLFGVRFIESPNAISVDNDSGVKVYQTLVYGADAFGTVDLTGGNLRTIVKPLGSAGSADPLDQRATVGWKAFDANVILNDDNMIRIESASAFN